MKIKGKIHSIETCGTVDGPGLRYVVFMQGCPLRCKYCHNPDTWKINDANIVMTVDELVEDIKKYSSYMKFSGGGVTISGGEPLLQSEFLLELFIKLKELNINTAIDTSGFVLNEKTKEVLKYTDLVLLDIKSINKEVYKNLTSVNLEPTLNFANYINQNNIKTWIRYVLVPTITDDMQDIYNLKKFIDTLSVVEKIEVLPFHKMGEFKWKELNLEYELDNINEPEEKLVAKVNEILNCKKVFVL